MLSHSSLYPSRDASSGERPIDGIADMQHAAADQFRSQPAAMNETFQHALLGQSLKMIARLRQPHAFELHRPDAENLPDQLVQRDPLRHEIASSGARFQSDAGLAPEDRSSPARSTSPRGRRRDSWKSYPRHGYTGRLPNPVRESRALRPAIPSGLQLDARCEWTPIDPRSFPPPMVGLYLRFLSCLSPPLLPSCPPRLLPNFLLCSRGPTPARCGSTRFARSPRPQALPSCPSRPLHLVSRRWHDSPAHRAGRSPERHGAAPESTGNLGRPGCGQRSGDRRPRRSRLGIASSSAATGA